MRSLIEPPQLYGVAALALLGVAAFLFVTAYAENAQPAPAETAAVTTSINAFQDISLQAKAAIVVDLKTGEVLYERNADTQLPLASITKVPLALSVADVLDQNDTITIPYDTAMTIGGQQLKAGQIWKVRDVMNFTLIASSNEGAQILAAAAGPKIRAKFLDAPQDASNIDTTLWRMNNLAQSNGWTGMYFLNVSGLDESTTQSGAYGTARSVAQMMAYAARTSSGTFAGTTQNDLLLESEDGATAAAYNTNEALGSIPGLIMGKTGFTDLAGGNLAVVFDVGLAHPVAAVVLGSNESARFTDMKQLVKDARATIIQ